MGVVLCNGNCYGEMGSKSASMRVFRADLHGERNVVC